MPGDSKPTPAMAQYERFKKRHPDCVLFFRMGDFYEMFNDDAITVSRVLGLTLTQRSPGQPMAGVPHHQLETYLKRALDAGLRVAICDQVQDPKDAKGVVARAVTRVCTPGTLVEDNLLADHAPSTLAAVLVEIDRACVAVADLATGSLTILDAPAGTVADALARQSVREILIPDDPPRPAWADALAGVLSASLTPRPSWHFRAAEAAQCLREHYAVATMQGFGLRDEDPALRPAGALLRYLQDTQLADPRDLPPEARTRCRASLAHLRPPKRDDPAGFLTLDAVSLRALEVERTLRGGATDGSLLGVMLSGPGGSRTPMGKRALRDWLCAPSSTLPVIHARHAAVAALVEDRRLARELGEALTGIQDIARISGRIAMGRATPRDLVGRGRSLARLSLVRASLAATPALAPHNLALGGVEADLAALGERIGAACVDSPPAHLRDGGLIRDGVDAQLDEARLLQTDAGQWLASFQARVATEHGLAQAKVGYNSIFGYYVELTAAQAREAGDALVRGGFRRKQTLKNAERYTNPELTEFEQKVATAQARAVQREQHLFDDLCRRVTSHLEPLAAAADTLASIDALLALADKAHARGWVRPQVIDAPALRITAGRHPVLDELLAGDFVPNDIDLGSTREPIRPGQPRMARDDDRDDPDHATLALITGPNMAGKSTFIRQVALIVLLAHAGSFVPAQAATIGLTDRIFTRVGADDALHRGQSTFMVEMTETAAILNNATPRSLVILDEIGRGTSTLDGLSLAWAITEHLATRACRTLFATHYHELTNLQDQLEGRLTNLHVQVKEWPDKDGHPQIVFLHRIMPGRADRSYGVHVARLAGLPRSVTDRARQVLESLSVQHGGDSTPVVSPVAAAKQPAPRSNGQRARHDGQFGLFAQTELHPALAELKSLHLDELSPLSAFDTLRRLKACVDARPE